ncbi:hypothetical protein ACFZAM_31920 [Streptomyces sp. NPDC008079]|uniref:hypothetical protein n=1 Tax=Streptomyces sp. NPDC008079 TaxID=3364806 RepID=UPI0036E622FA
MENKRVTAPVTAQDVTDEMIELTVAVTKERYANGLDNWQDVWDLVSGAQLADGSILVLGGDPLSPALVRIKEAVRAADNEAHTVVYDKHADRWIVLNSRGLRVADAATESIAKGIRTRRERVPAGLARSDGPMLQTARDNVRFYSAFGQSRTLRAWSRATGIGMPTLRSGAQRRGGMEEYLRAKGLGPDDLR